MKINGRELKLERGKDKPDMGYYHGQPFIMGKETAEEGFEFKKIGESRLIHALKNGYVFIGSLEEWAQFKKNNLEYLLTEDLLKEVV